MRRWVLKDSEIVTSTSDQEPAWEISLVEDPTGLKCQISVQETADNLLNPKSLLARLACHVVVTRIPEEGLGELCESVGDIYSYYRSRIPSRLSLPPARQSIPARLTQPYQVPGFEIAEE